MHSEAIFLDRGSGLAWIALHKCSLVGLYQWDTSLILDQCPVADLLVDGWVVDQCCLLRLLLFIGVRGCTWALGTGSRSTKRGLASCARSAHELVVHGLSFLAVLLQLTLSRVLTFLPLRAVDLVLGYATLVRIVTCCVWDLEPRQTSIGSSITSSSLCQLHFSVNLLPEVHVLLDLCVLLEHRESSLDCVLPIRYNEKFLSNLL